jgi:hypothetical protein
MTAPRLTKPQVACLTDAVGDYWSGRIRARNTYAPVVKLVERGYLTDLGGTFGHHVFEVTAAGREALKDAKKASGE